MEIKYTKGFLAKLEELVTAAGYVLRYEKGQFRSGFCLLKDTQVAVVNKFFPLEGRINSLLEMIGQLSIQEENLTETQIKLLRAIRAKSLRQLEIQPRQNQG